MMPEAVFLADVHLSAHDASVERRLLQFLQQAGRTSSRIFILGDLFDFWFGPSQARWRSCGRALAAIREVARSGVEVTFYHGNRDFYLHEDTARRYGFRLVREYSIEEVCGRRMLLCHGDMLCTNDISYHRARRFLRHPATERFVRSLPPPAALTLAMMYRFCSKLIVPAKTRWVVGIERKAAERHFALGADTIICGHTHSEERLGIDTPHGRREIFTLGDFGVEGSYLECEAGVLRFRRFTPDAG